MEELVPGGMGFVGGLASYFIRFRNGTKGTMWPETLRFCRMVLKLVVRTGADERDLRSGFG